MNSIPIEKSKMSTLATMILNDIRQRGLQPGDRYLNGQELADRFGISLMKANRAMQLLAKRNMLERRQRAGTFIGSAARSLNSEQAALKCVHLLMPDGYFRVYRAQLEVTVTGLHSELPDSAIQYTFLPADGPLPFVRKLVEQAAAVQSIEGVVLYISPPEVQNFFDHAGIPSVVFGSVYPEVSLLPWVDRDQQQIGRLLAEHLISRKHRRIAVLMRAHWGYGDNLMIDGVQKVLAQANGRHLTIRSLPVAREMAAGSVRMLLEGKERPTALICRSQSLANTAVEIAGDLALKMPGDLEIAICDPVLDGDGGDARFTVAQPEIEQEEQGAIIGRILKQLAAGKRPEPDHLSIPVRLRLAKIVKPKF
jgi:DNA-binding LacI/PurR family transcriptional regulator